jgi:hypothetical protein
MAVRMIRTRSTHCGIGAAMSAVMAHDRAAALAGDRGPSIYVFD